MYIHYYVCFENHYLGVDITGDCATELPENQGTDVDCHCQTFQPNLVPTSAVNQAHGDFNTLNIRNKGRCKLCG